MHNPELELANEFVRLTNKNIFLTGKAGTGKTTFLKSLKNNISKRSVVVAPTGVAAINAGGVTMHSFFQLPFGPIITEKASGQKVDNPNFRQKFNKQKINIVKTLDLLIIDEISMVRADVLDAVDEILRRYKHPYLPFGGTQLLMIGDIQQLAPVVKNEEKQMLGQYYKSMYFFNSYALKEAKPVTIELKHIYRQKDNAFVEILNEVRDNKLSRSSYDKLHRRFTPDFETDNNDGYITLTTHNRTADAINEKKLNLLKSTSKYFEADVKGRFSEHSYPTDYKLKLKKGAQVMFVKNDSAREKRYFNGKIGTVTGFDQDTIFVKCKGEDSPIETLPETWENIRYTIDQETKKITEEFIGSFTQYPLRLAWAVTIHKSQGLTFEKAVIDAADAFAHGQTYVALSRCKTLEGMVLSSKISESAIICDDEVVDFNKNNQKNQPGREDLKQAVYDYQKELLEELFNYKQLSYRFRTFDKQLKEFHKNYSGSLGQLILDLNKSVLPKITAVAKKFIIQIHQILKNKPDAENNTELQERLKKASQYFTKYHEEQIINAIENASFETDNKAVKTAVNESLASVEEILNVKQKCLNECLSGFNVKNYLDTRAKVLLDKKKKQKSQAKPKEVETKYPKLFARLKAWRADRAETENVELYRILPNKTLQEIANRLPVETHQLKQIKGIGKKKLERFGEELLQMSENFCKENNLEPDSSPPSPKKPPKKSNHEISIQLYRDGKSIEEIAKAQDFVASTIENHLSKYVATGELPVEDFVNSDKLKTIKDYFSDNPDSNLSAAKESLPDDISYSELKFVQKHLEYVQKKTKAE